MTEGPQPPGRASLPAASILFLLSGATALAYQIVWFKRFSYVWGNSSLAMAAVVASFLAGLGLGAWGVGRLADRLRTPLLWYGLSELLIGGLALVIPLEIAAVNEWASRFYVDLQGQPGAQFVVRFGLTFLVLGPPCFLMGGTLPLLVKQFTPAGSALRHATGWLYGINTLGAAIGCYATGFHVLPGIGLYWTNTGTAALNLAIGVAAVAVAARIARRAASPQTDPSPGSLTEPELAAPPAGSARPSPTTSGHSFAMLGLAAGLTGFAALVLEMVWARQLALILGGSTYAFTSMLFLVLVGIGCGSLLFHAAREKLARFAFAAPTVIAALIVTTVAGKWCIPQLTDLVGSARMLRGSQSMNAALCITASAVLELLPAMGMGVLFPLLVDLTRRGAAEAGRAVGGIYAWNTFGSIAGSALGALVLIPAVGTAGSVALALGIYGAALIVVSPSVQGWRRSAAFFALCLVSGTAVFLSLNSADPRITNKGAFLYGPASEADLDSQVLMFREGRSCNVLVTRYGSAVSLRVNGKVDASNFGDMKMQVGSAYVPLFLKPDSRDILVIGFGSGCSAGAALLFPETDVTCCEIEPAVVAASEHFHEVNHRPEESPHFRAIYDDGRSYLQGTRQSFDLIISEPSNPWMAGLSNLYSREFYQAARERLSDEGILVQWLQTYSFSPEDYALVARTILSVFPHAAYVRISDGDSMLLASARPLAPELEDVRRAQEIVDRTAEISRDLERYFVTSDVRSILLTHLLLDTGGLERLVERVGDDTINTDLNLRLEFDAPLRLFSTRYTSEMVFEALRQQARAEMFEETAEKLECDARHADAFHKLAFLFDKDDQRKLVVDLIRKGLELDADRPALVADLLVVSPPETEEALVREIERLIGLSSLEARRVAASYLKDSRNDYARIALETIIAAFPDSVTARVDLARVQSALGDTEAAREALDRALELDPVNASALKLRGTLEASEADGELDPSAE